MISIKYKKNINIKESFYDNSFDLLRLIAAISVVLLHGFLYFSNGAINKPFFIHPFSFVHGVKMLFAISAFCVCASFDREKSLIKYFKKRSTRIFPSLWIVVILNTIIIFSLYAIPHIKDLILYLGTQFTFLQFYTGDWLRGYGVGVPNPSLWTIVVEIQLYILIAMFYKKIKNWSLKNWVVLLIVSFVITFIPYALSNYLPEVLGKLYGQTFFPYLPVFITGAMIYNFREKILPILLKYYWIIFSIYVLFIVLYSGFNISFFGPSLTSVYAYKHHSTPMDILIVVITIATAYKFGTIRFKYDISYPMYLFHMIIFNIFVHFNFDTTIWHLYLGIAITIIISIIYAVFIEKPIINYFNKKFKISKSDSK